jgi:hypothetical protein
MGLARDAFEAGTDYDRTESSAAQGRSSGPEIPHLRGTLLGHQPPDVPDGLLAPASHWERNIQGWMSARNCSASAHGARSAARH